MDKSTNKSKRFLVVYMSVLLATALVLLTLSYLANMRDRDRLSDLEQEHTAFSATAQLSIEELRDEVMRLTQAVDEKTAELQSVRSDFDSYRILQNSTIADLGKSRDEAWQSDAESRKDLSQLYALFEIVKKVYEKDYRTAAQLVEQAHHGIAESMTKYHYAAGEYNVYFYDYMPVLETLEKEGYVNLEIDENGDVVSVKVTDK